MDTHTDPARREALGQRVDEATERLCKLGLSKAPAVEIEAAKDALRAAVRDWNATWRTEDIHPTGPTG